MAKAETVFFQESLFATLHGESDAGPGGNGVQSPVIASPGGLQDGAAVPDAAQRSQGEQAFVLQTDFSFRRRIDVFAANRAGGAGSSGQFVGRVQSLAGKGGGLGKGALLKIPRRQGRQAIKRQQV